MSLAGKRITEVRAFSADEAESQGWPASAAQNTVAVSSLPLRIIFNIYVLWLLCVCVCARVCVTMARGNAGRTRRWYVVVRGDESRRRGTGRNVRSTTQR